MTSRLAFGAAFLALLAASPNASAALPTGNLIANGDAEAGPGATNATDVVAPPGWDTIPNFTAVVYGSGEFPSTAESTRIGGGSNFFAGGPGGGPGDSLSAAYQEIDLTGAAAEIDAGNVQATFTADAGGYASQEDNASGVVIFLDPTEQQASGVVAFGGPDSSERGGQTTFVRRTGCATVAPGARKARVQVSVVRDSGTYNDGYLDNLKLTLSTAPCPVGDSTPLEPPAPPQAGLTGNAEPVKGRIFVKKPGSSEFQELTDARSIPVGSEVDARKGTVELQTAADSQGTAQIGKFYDGSFVMTQTSGARPLTDLVLTGGRIDKCPSGKQVGTAATRARRLWGNARGRFRTRGRYASATVRGTQWQVRDTCTTTTVSVRRGTVTVRDFSKRRNIKLKAPKKYTARARKK